MLDNSLFIRLLLLFHVIIFSQAQSDLTSRLNISSVDPDNQTYPIYSSSGVFPEWNTMNIRCSACNAPDVAVEYFDIAKRNFTFTNEGETQMKIEKFEVRSQDHIIMNPEVDQSPSVELLPGEKQIFTVTYNCDNTRILKDDINGWSYIEVSAMVDGNAVSFNYLKVCTLENRQAADYSIYVVLTIAVIVVAIGTRQKKTLLGEQAQHMDEIKPLHAIFFVVFASFSLLILYFFSEYIKNVITGIFVIYALTGCSVIFGEWTEKFFRNNAFWTKHYQVKFIGPVNFHNVVCFIIAGMITAAWFFTRNWVFNNIIGLSIVFLIFKVVKLPSLKVAYLLLGMAFLYDIFWVFLSKPIFGKSVMIEAATALDIPIKIEWPYLGETPLPRCALLGLGDMVLPGFFVAFNYRFGLYKKTKDYYWSSVIAYALGIASCGAFLIIMRAGQPALLYIVPFMLGFATIVAKKRGELKEMWDGIPENIEYLNMSKDPSPRRIQMSIK